MLHIVVSALISLGMILGAYNYTEQHDLPRLGANSTISGLSEKTVPSGIDTFPIVDNVAIPATTKKMTFANATSSFKVYNDTLYSPMVGNTSLVTTGNITTGTWNGTTINVDKGGTGSTSLAQYQILLGSSTNPIGVVSGVGVSGQFLTSQGAGKVPSWQTAAINVADNYTWTGVHAFNGTTTGLMRFGGNGSDGALSLSSGTTTINLQGLSTFEKNYTSISITSTGHLAFSNPHASGTLVILKSLGSVTLTCSIPPCIDLGGIGSAGGVGVVNTAGTDGTAATPYFLISSAGGSAGGSGAGNAVGGATSTSFTLNPIAIANYLSGTTTVGKYGGLFWLGAGGGAGGSAGGGASGGNGGRGGGGLLIESAAAWNFTTTGGISAKGENGVTGAGSCNVGGGGGGGGGFVKVFYGSLTANSGTIVTTGGTGGNSACSDGHNGGGGASGTNGGFTGSNATAGTGASGFSSVSSIN
jgi:hypothetical protein